MTNTRIAAAATALVLGATGLAACNDSEDTTDSVTTPTDGVVSDVSDAVTTGGATAGDTGSTGGTDSTGDAVVSDTAVVSEDPLEPTDAVISDEVVTNSIPADGAAGGAADDAAGSAATAPTN